MNFLVQTVLSPRYNLVPVSDVYQGMGELKRSEDIDLIIVDLDYQTQENLDFIQHIKTSGLYQEKAVIVLMSKDKWQSGKSESSRFDKCFYKPFSPEEMVRSIDELMYSRIEKITQP